MSVREGFYSDPAYPPPYSEGFKSAIERAAINHKALCQQKEKDKAARMLDLIKSLHASLITHGEWMDANSPMGEIELRVERAVHDRLVDVLCDKITELAHHRVKNEIF